MRIVFKFIIKDPTYQSYVIDDYLSKSIKHNKTQELSSYYRVHQVHSTTGNLCLFLLLSFDPEK